jgi:hypothetical protein
VSPSLLLLAAFAQMVRPTIVAPPVPALPPETAPAPQSDLARPRLNAFTPDLVVKEIRRDGDKGFQILVGNQGNARSGDRAPVGLTLYSDVDSTESLVIGAVEPLDAGAAQWVPFDFERAECLMPGLDYNCLHSLYRPAMVDLVVAHVDGGIPRSAGPTTTSEWARCKTDHGCVAERDEDNNSLRMEKSDMEEFDPAAAIKIPSIPTIGP